MPIVPFTPPQRTRSGKPLPPPPAEPFALMAAAQMHAEGRLIQASDQPKGGEYIGELNPKDIDNNTVFDGVTATVPYGRRNGDTIEKHTEPEDIMKNQPADSEGFTVPGNPYVHIRKKVEAVPTS